MSYRYDFISKAKAMSNQNTERARVESLLGNLDQQPRLAFPLPRRQIAAPSAQGVYLIRAADGAVLHVGRTVSGEKGLAQRLRNHLSGKSSFVRSYLNGNAGLLRSGFTFQYIEVENDRERALLEHHAVAWYCPAHLGLGRESAE